MRVFVYEFVTGGGWRAHSPELPPASLLAEGLAMLRALLIDFGGIPQVRVETLCDARYRDLPLPADVIHEVSNAGQDLCAIRELAATADWSVIIAPEFCGHLYNRCRAVEDSGGRLLGPDSNLVALAGDKQLLADFLRHRGVPMPQGRALDPGEPLPRDFCYPAVLKPRDGAGSLGIESVRSHKAGRQNGAASARLERFCPGTAVSVSFLYGPAERLALPAARQFLSENGRFAYLGGSLPLEPSLAERAKRLATRAVKELPRCLGYLGVDLVLGPDPAGNDDVVIEINPRLTTSYVGLRALAKANLAESMMSIAAGRAVELCWHPGPVQFEAAGHMLPIQV